MNYSLKIIYPQNYKDDLTHKAYHFWYSLWSDAFQNDLKNSGSMYSNDFMNSHEVMLVMDGESIAGMILFNELDKSSPYVDHDKYFKTWPGESVEKLFSEGEKSCHYTYFCIDKKYRKTIVKDLLAYSIVKHFESKKDLSSFAGTIRVNRSMNRPFRDLGADTLNSGLWFKEMNAEIDLIAFFRSSLTSRFHEVRNVLYERIWRERGFQEIDSLISA